MAILTELGVVNNCLGTLGELPVNSLEDDHSLIAAARRAFAETNLREQSAQWWFNTEKITLNADADGYIWTPADAIRVDPEDTSLPYIQRGRRLYDPTRGTYKIKESRVVCDLVRNVAFDDLPPTAQIVIGVATALKFMVYYDADSTRYRQLLSEYQEAHAKMNAEHMRNMDSNILERHSTLGILSRVRGYGRFTR